VEGWGIAGRQEPARFKQITIGFIRVQRQISNMWQLLCIYDIFSP